MMLVIIKGSCNIPVFHFATTLFHQVLISESEAKAGLKLAPSEKEVKVADRPVDGIRFSQFRAKVSGTIYCLGM